VVTKRLAEVFMKRKILIVPNYIDLLENSTEQSVYILNIIIEEEKKRIKKHRYFCKT
jgi:hypothetical protein